MNGIIQISKIHASPPLIMQSIEPLPPSAALPPRSTSVRKHKIVIPLPKFGQIPRPLPRAVSTSARTRRPLTRSFDKSESIDSGTNSARSLRNKRSFSGNFTPRGNPPCVTASSWCVYDGNKGTRLHGKNYQLRREIASMTKIMT